MTNISWSSITTSRVLPAGFYNLRIAGAELTHNTYNGLLQINLELRVDAPDMAKGKAHYEFLVLGKEAYKTIKPEWSSEFQEFAAISDPDFEDPRVHQKSKELKTFKRMLECSGFQFPGEATLEDIVALSVGKVFSAEVVVSLHEYGKRAGEEKNELKAIFPFGTETPRLSNGSVPGASKVAKPTANRPVAGTAVRPVPMMTAVAPAPAVDFFDDED